MSKPRFIHLNTHTEYSIKDGLLRVKPLVSTCGSLNMPAVAVTDHVNLFSLVKFYRAALSAGVKPIVGAELLFESENNETPPSQCIFLCQNETGYKNLTRLITRAYIENQQLTGALVKYEWLTPHSVDGLIVLSGGMHGDIGQALLANQAEEAAMRLDAWFKLFPNRFYIELQRIGLPGENAYIKSVLPIAQKARCPVVATNATRFLNKDDFEAHEARVCIHGGHILADPKRPRKYTVNQYLRTPEEMERLFADIPSAIENTVEIAKRCNLQLTLGKNFLPNFPVPEGLTIEEYLTQKSELGLEVRLKSLYGSGYKGDKEQYQRYYDRLKTELDMINNMGFPGYFLIVADFIAWAKAHDVPVGPGRGSGAGSLVAYVLKITDLDPLQHDLLFERFLNPERVSMPDFDIDFCMEGRDRVIEYVADKYGSDSVSQIITYGTMAAKAVVRDVGRVLGHPYGFVDKIAKLIPFELGITLDKALEQEQLLNARYHEEDDVKVLIDLAKKLEGVTRNAGKHAGGVVIAPSVLTDFSPLYCEPGGKNRVTQFDKDDVEAVGLVKFDFLGLRTLTIIKWALEAVNRRLKAEGKPLIDISQIPTDDEKTFDILKACQTTAVFQLESRGMKDLVKRIQPDNFEEIVALVALFRPGPLQSGMVDDFIDRKHGRAKVEYSHPDLAPILKHTYGVILYQEQVMQIAQVLANYTLGGADVLRRAMGKKKPEEMAKQRKIFVKGALANGIDRNLATHIFDLMEKFAGYGFNKSHSAAYALLAYQTAWLKTHYPAEFMSAVLSSDMDNTDKVVNFIEECKHMRLKVLPPDINRSEHAFIVNVDGAIVYGLGAIKGAGESAIESIIHARKENGAFTSLLNFCERVDLRKVNRRVLVALIHAGAMDSLQIPRWDLMASVDKALKQSEQQAKNASHGQEDLFSGVIEAKDDFEYIKVTPWSDEVRLGGEKQTLGLYLTGHPIERFESILPNIISCRVKALETKVGKTVTIVGLVIGLRTLINKRGDRMAFVTIDDNTGRIEIAIFSDNFEKYRSLLEKDKIIIVRGDVSVDDYSGGFRMRCNEIIPIEHAQAMYAKQLKLDLEDTPVDDAFIEKLKHILTPFKAGACPVVLKYRSNQAQAEISLGREWAVTPKEALLKQLSEFLGDKSVELQYN